MKVQLYDSVGSVWVARVLGPCPTYVFDRRFVEPDSESPARGTKHKAGTILMKYLLSDGIYEMRDADSARTVFAIINNRRIHLECHELKKVIKICQTTDCEFGQIVAEWKKSRGRTSKTLLHIARKLTESVRKAQRDEKQRRAAMRREIAASIGADEAFVGSDGTVTTLFLKRLEKAGPDGKLAAQLFRSLKASTRAKMYFGKYRDGAYERKAERIEELCWILSSREVFSWGWAVDEEEPFAKWVIYIDLPQGQVSFHSPKRFVGPDYQGEWDMEYESTNRILEYCDSLLESQVMAV